MAHLCGWELSWGVTKAPTCGHSMGFGLLTAQPWVLRENIPGADIPGGTKLKLPNQLKVVPRNDTVSCLLCSVSQSSHRANQMQVRREISSTS